MEIIQGQNYMMNFYNNNNNELQKKFMNIKNDDIIISDNEENMYASEDSSYSSSFEASNNSKDSSSSSLDLLDDASSSISRSPNGPLHGLSELMDHLPIKRGLSKYYQGKSQSFTSLARVTSLEDLAKKQSPYQKRLKACKSYGGGLNNTTTTNFIRSPKSTISKKLSNNSNYNKGSLSNLSSLNRKVSFIISSVPPLCPVQRDL